MNEAHLHLIVNHVPVIGTIIGIGLLAFAVWKKSTDVTLVAMYLFVILAIAAVLVYLTGEPAEEVVEGIAGVSDAMLERHEEAALISTFLVGLYGLFAAGTLAFARKRSAAISRRSSVIALILAVAPAAAMGYTANLGGHIRHSEIGAPPAVSVEDEGTHEDPAIPAAGLEM